APAGGRIPWGHWAGPVGRWMIFFGFFSLAALFMCAILRRQWADRERLQFPLARVPIEFTEGSAGGGWLPRVFANRAFQMGVLLTTAFRFCRALPFFFGAETAWGITIPLQDILRDTPLEQLQLLNFSLWWIPIGFAYLVPADVSLSVWFFYLVGHSELQVASWMGSTLGYGGRNSALLTFQQVASYLTFSIGALYMARRHLGTVLRKAVGLARAVDDSGEAVGYRVAFWGLAISFAGAIAWLAYYGMKVWVAAAMFALLMVIQFVHARIAAQGGVYVPRSHFQVPGVLQSLGPRVFSPTGSVVAQMQWGGMMQDTVSLMAPVAIHSFYIGELFGKRRKLLLPVLVVALAVGTAAASYTTLRAAYTDKALNFSYRWGTISNPKMHFDTAHQRFERPGEVPPGLWKPFTLGVAVTGFVMFMRARFYWWPIHPIGLLTIANHHTDRMWLSFFLGWLVKVVLMKFGTGRMVRQGRYFFIGLILVESFFEGLAAILRVLSGGVTPLF
ncbi:MAG: DUF6785 family protein, partial [Planctomycetota bacterium]